MFRIISTLMLVCALTISACDDKEKPVEDCQEVPVAAVEAPVEDQGLPEECAGEECPPVEEECLEDCEPVEEPIEEEEECLEDCEPVEDPVEECPEEGCEEPVEEPQAGEEAPEVDPPIPG